LVKQRLLGALTALGLSVAAAHADPVRLAQAIPGLLPAPEIAAIVRSAGFEPLSPAMRRGDSYVLRAAGRDGREMRLVISARSGEIVSATPVAAAGPGGERLGPYERMDAPPGYVPPPIIHERDTPMRRPLANVPRSPDGLVPETDEPMPPAGAAPNIPREERGEHGLLPPPPERFPPRAAPAPAQPQKPAARPTPVKRASATPLPKPRPAGSETSATPEEQPQQPPTPAAAPAPTPPPAAPAPAAPDAPPGKVDPRSLPH
jgi:hypothetical protein